MGEKNKSIKKKMRIDEEEFENNEFELENLKLEKKKKSYDTPQLNVLTFS